MHYIKGYATKKLEEGKAKRKLKLTEKLRNQGLSYREIGRRLGASHKTIMNWDNGHKQRGVSHTKIA